MRRTDRVEAAITIFALRVVKFQTAVTVIVRCRSWVGLSVAARSTRKFPRKSRAHPCPARPSTFWGAFAEHVLRSVWRLPGQMAVVGAGVGEQAWSKRKGHQRSGTTSIPNGVYINIESGPRSILRGMSFE